MKILSKDKLQKIAKGAIFIHPTDTIYGLGCDATNEKAVNKIRKLKKRPTAPFSIIAPSKLWIKKYCNLNSKTKKSLSKLPGPYTFILELKNNHPLAKSVLIESRTVGIRMPKHWFAKTATKLNLPLVSTSANLSGKLFMTSLENCEPSIKKGVDFIVYEGKKEARPSTVIDFTKKEIKIIKR